MSGSANPRWRGKRYTGIPGACATRNITYLAIGPLSGPFVVPYLRKLLAVVFLLWSHDLCSGLCQTLVILDTGVIPCTLLVSVHVMNVNANIGHRKDMDIMTPFYRRLHKLLNLRLQLLLFNFILDEHRYCNRASITNGYKNENHTLMI